MNEELAPVLIISLFSFSSVIVICLALVRIKTYDASEKSIEDFFEAKASIVKLQAEVEKHKYEAKINLDRGDRHSNGRDHAEDRLYRLQELFAKMIEKNSDLEAFKLAFDKIKQEVPKETK